MSSVTRDTKRRINKNFNELQRRLKSLPEVVDTFRAATDEWRKWDGRRKVTMSGDQFISDGELELKIDVVLAPPDTIKKEGFILLESLFDIDGVEPRYSDEDYGIKTILNYKGIVIVVELISTRCRWVVKGREMRDIVEMVCD